eukprot:scaffold213_cov245-Pinguiococcus_pyrenoidosus.AAC.42
MVASFSYRFATLGYIKNPHLQRSRPLPCSHWRRRHLHPPPDQHTTMRCDTEAISVSAIPGARHLDLAEAEVGVHLDAVVHGVAHAVLHDGLAGVAGQVETEEAGVRLGQVLVGMLLGVIAHRRLHLELLRERLVVRRQLSPCPHEPQELRSVVVREATQHSPEHPHVRSIGRQLFVVLGVSL